MEQITFERLPLLFTLTNDCGCQVGLAKGNKASPIGIDFVTGFNDPIVSPRWRIPKHEHVTSDIIGKALSYQGAFEDLIVYFREILNYLKSLPPLHAYPISEQIGQVDPTLRNRIISRINEKHLFHIEDLLQIYELIMWQEVTRYPEGKLSAKILDLLEKRDLFAAVRTATRKRV